MGWDEGRKKKEIETYLGYLQANSFFLSVNRTTGMATVLPLPSSDRRPVT